MSIVVVGSVAFDAVKTPHGQRDRLLGGAATYFSLAASYFTQVGVVAVVGEDFGAEELRVFRERDISTVGLEHAPGKSFFWAGEYHNNMNDRTTLDTQLNVFANFQPRIPDVYKDYDYLFLGNIDPELQLHVQGQIDARMVGGDTMNYWIYRKPEELRRTLRKVDTLMINDSEARDLTGEYNLLRAASHIHALGPKTLVVKRGENGATMYRDGEVFTVPGFPLEQVCDPTGAGDSFGGGFFGCLAAEGEVNSRTLRRAMVYGSVLGSFCVEQFGTERLQSLSREEIDQRFARFRQMMSFD
jgi:sugar/nucleoside kinase (ribokinase family)